MKQYDIAVVGATGMVGNKFLEVLEERKLPVKNYYLFASKKSAGKVINFMGKPHTVLELNKENILSHKADFALFSAGGGTSKEFAPIFAEYGCIVVDNSSQWRMDKDVPLVVPEVNPEDIKKKEKPMEKDVFITKDDSVGEQCRPQCAGLYSPQNEHDACGVGMIVNILY